MILPTGMDEPELDHALLPPDVRAFLDRLLQLQLLGRSAAGLFLQQSAHLLTELASAEALGNALVQSGLLTAYQVNRVLTGAAHGLILGNHRVLEPLGTGCLGTVFLAEHLLLKRRVAIKALPVDEDVPAAILNRFYAEMRVLAELHHPHIVMAFDAGNLPPPGPDMPGLLYLVMELVPGGDLEQYVTDHGPVPVAQACDWIRQAACGLQEAHDHHVIHRDVKPSNLLLAKQSQVKLVDFGLVRQFCQRLTDPRALLGSVEFMAPEQSFDPSTVGGQADIYGLGATLFWLLTGQTPYPQAQTLAKALWALQQDRPRRLEMLRPDVPPELVALVDRMLDRDPARRPALPVTVMNALARFAAPAAPSWEISDWESPPLSAPIRGISELEFGTLDLDPRTSQSWRVLIVDDEPALRDLVRAALEPLGCWCREVGDAETALAAVQEESYDLVLLDLNLPGGPDGYEVCGRLRERPPRPHLKILVISGRGHQHELAEALARGADDYIAKPFDPRQLAAKVQHTLRLKDAQDRADLLARHLLLSNRQLERSLQARVGDVQQAQDALLFAMAKMAESRDGETADHMHRLQLYTRCLAERLAGDPSWAGIVSDPFLDQLDRCVPLHDIGKIGLPDSVLCKTGPLDAAERALMETHTVIGVNILDALGREHGESLAFLTLATVIVRHHHERHDGQGYPDHLAGDAIPPAARLVVLADVYDALRRQRFHKPALSHAEALRLVREGSDGQFDPAVLQAFASCQDEFDRIYQKVRS